MSLIVLGDNGNHSIVVHTLNVGWANWAGVGVCDEDLVGVWGKWVAGEEAG